MRAAPRGCARRRAGVVIEPSTSERSYGPSTTRAASPRGSRRSRRRSATASSSSSQSSSVSWQPSHEANFQTASLGALARRAMRQISRSAEAGADAVEAEAPGRPCRRSAGRTGSGRRSPTAHFMLRSIETIDALVGRRRARSSSRTVKRIITSGPQTKRDACAGSNAPRRAARARRRRRPLQSAPARSTVTRDRAAGAAAASARARRGRASPRACARRRGARPGR